MKKILTALGEPNLPQKRGLDVIASSRSEFAARLANEQQKWAEVLRNRGIKPEQAKPGDDAAMLFVTSVAATSLAGTALR